MAGCAVWFYLWKLIWPVNLIFVYPRWSIDERNVLSYLPGVLLVIILALAWWQRHSWGRPVVMLMRLLRGAVVAGVGLRQHLLHAILVWWPITGSTRP